MAMIQCPECGRAVSSAAFSCPFCGYPIADGEEAGYVRIKTPAEIPGAPSYAFRKTQVMIRGEKGVLWTGDLGTAARFRVTGPTEITIDMGNHARGLHATVYPRTEYRMDYVYSRWWNLPEYRLVEI